MWRRVSRVCPFAASWVPPRRASYVPSRTWHSRYQIPMPIHWPEATVRGRELTVYVGPGASRSTVWMNVLGHLLKEFNNVAKEHKLPMRMKASTQPPKD